MLRTRNLLPLFLNESLRSVAVSWLSIFSAVFIYQKMLETASSSLALAVVFFSFVLFGLGKLLGDCWAEELSLKKGLKMQLVLGLILMGISLILFNLFSRNALFLIPAELIWGFSTGVYWFGWYGIVGKLGRLGRYGSAFGESSFLRGIAEFLAPIGGGLLINFGGYCLLFFSGVCLIIIALLCLVFLEEEKTHRDTDIKEVFRLFVTHKRTFAAYFSLGTLGAVASTSFVLYLALILKEEVGLGKFFSASVLLVALIKFLIGKEVDWWKKEFIVLGSLVRSFVWLGRLLTRSVLLLLGLNVANSLAQALVGIPLGVLSLEKAVDGHSTGRAILFRETAISLGYMGAGLVLGILAIWGLPLEAGFVLAVPLALVPIWVGGE